jgi:hypothetical protein
VCSEATLPNRRGIRGGRRLSRQASLLDPSGHLVPFPQRRCRAVRKLGKHRECRPRNPQAVERAVESKAWLQIDKPLSGAREVRLSPKAVSLQGAVSLGRSRLGPPCIRRGSKRLACAVRTRPGPASPNREVLNAAARRLPGESLGTCRGEALGGSQTRFYLR